MNQPHMQTEGLVVREAAYKEADKILTIFTPEHGLMTTRAKGVKRKNSPIAAGCQLLTWSGFDLYINRERASVEAAEPREMFLGLRNDIRALSLASYFAELVCAVSEADSPAEGILRLILNAFYALSEGLRSPELIKPAFELRLMALSGFHPELGRCAVCGFEPGAACFNIHRAALVCASCRGGAGPGVILPLCAGALDAMRYVLSCDLKRIFSFSLDGESLISFDEACEAYLLAQVDRGFRSLDYYKNF